VQARGGGDGYWTLDTSGMQCCGYIVGLDVVDDGIVNDTDHGHRADDGGGVCLLEPGKEDDA